MKTRADWLAEAPFTLVLSAGFFGFFAHTGLLLALEQAGLRPRRVVGTSAGAIAGGAWASGVPARELAQRLEGLRRDDFWDPVWRRPADRRRDPGTPLGLLRGRKMDGLLADVLADGVDSIEDCPTPLAVVTHDLRRRRTTVHERGPIRPAIRASAALPVLFGPVRVEGRLHADGGISDRPGFSALDPAERCLYHHLPHTSRWPRPSGDDAAERVECERRRVIAIDGLPRAGPMALVEGRRALTFARDQTARWLSRADPHRRADPRRCP